MKKFHDFSPEFIEDVMAYSKSGPISGRLDFDGKMIPFEVRYDPASAMYSVWIDDKEEAGKPEA